MSLTIVKRVTLTYSADDWELYTSSDRPACEAAAAEINRAIEAAVNADWTETEVLGAADAVMLKHADLGAADSEPMHKLERILERIFRPRPEVRR